MLTVRVSKKQWDRGNGDSYLRRQNGKMCCIGFLAKACKATDSDITGLQRLENVQNNDTKTICSANPELLDKAYGINDSEIITDNFRIKQLRELGKQMSVKFVFVP